MREIRPCGFVRGVLGDRYPYRRSQTSLLRTVSRFWLTAQAPHRRKTANRREKLPVSEKPTTGKLARNPTPPPFQPGLLTLSAEAALSVNGCLRHLDQTAGRKVRVTNTAPATTVAVGVAVPSCFRGNASSRIFQFA